VSVAGPFALVLLLIVVCPRRALADETTDDYAIAASGRRFRVSFDPASRLRLGVAGAYDADGPAPELLAGIAYRARWATGRGSERIVWQLDHRIADGWVEPMLRTGRSVPALDATIYSLAALRHDTSPVLVVPSSPPIGLPFPFDVGF
jgi:hypothetical protein